MIIGSQHSKNNIDKSVTIKSVTIHHRNLQVLATELHEVHHGLAPELMNIF